MSLSNSSGLRIPGRRDRENVTGGAEGSGGWKAFGSLVAQRNFLWQLPHTGREPVPACPTEGGWLQLHCGLQSQEWCTEGACSMGPGGGGARGWKGKEPGLRVASGFKQLSLEIEENLSGKWEGSGRTPRAGEQQVPANLRRK